MTPEQLERWLAAHPLIDVAPNGTDSYFTGSLAQGQVLARLNRHIAVTQDAGLHWWVRFYDDPDDLNSESEWGKGTTQEEAWRYVLGAYFGPADAEYDEPRLYQALERGQW